MLILGIDNTTQINSVALVKGNKILGELTSQKPQRQLTWIMPAIKDLLIKARVSFSQLEGVAVTTGPGTYTGVRLGLATAKTIAQVLNLGLVGFNTLDVLALNISNFKGLICPVLDAKKGEVFTALFKSKSAVSSPRLRPERIKSIGFHRISQYLLLKPEEFSNWLNNQNKKIVIFGTALGIYQDLWEKKLKVDYTLASQEKWHPKASQLALKASKEFAVKKKKYFQVKAFYLRKPDAKVVSTVNIVSREYREL